MARLVSKRTEKAGLPPGTLVHEGQKPAGDVRITVLDYSESEFQEKEISADECCAFRDTSTVTWINVDGIHNTDVIERIGQHFSLHPLLLEDIAHTGQRAKTEDYVDYLFTILHMLYVDEETGELGAEQVSLVLGPGFVLSFQERPGDVFEQIRERIRNGKGRIRKMGADYLAYALIDAIVDNYFVILEGVGEQIEELEDVLVSHATPESSREIHRMKREALFLRKSVWPLREVISGLSRGESPLIKPDTVPYFRDVYDHTIQVVDTIETFRDALAGMRDAYLTVLSNRMNEVMKVLTIIATIFIPLTFIAGIYGMNFDLMPELRWRGGYFITLGLMGLVAAAMLYYFKRKKWL